MRDAAFRYELDTVYLSQDRVVGTRKPNSLAPQKDGFPITSPKTQVIDKKRRQGGECGLNAGGGAEILLTVRDSGYPLSVRAVAKVLVAP